MSAGALAGMRVLDITQVLAGSYCSMLLADMGADVIKVEKHIGGDDTRRMGPGDGEKSPAFQAVNRNKRGLAIDLASPAGVAVLRTMVAKADVVVENFRPGALTKLGLGWEDLREINPSLIYCSISGFGRTGPYADRGGFDLVAQGMSGLMSLTGFDGAEPVKVGVPICDVNAGMLGAIGVLTAYVHRLRTGEGQLVDTSLFEAGIATTLWETALYTAFGVVSRPSGSAHRLSAPYQALATADGHVTVGAANEATWKRLCGALNRADLIDDERFRASQSRVQNREVLAAELESELAAMTSSEVAAKLQAAGVPCGPLHDIAEVYQDPQTRARDMLIDIDHPVAGPTQQIGFPIKLSQTPGEVRRAAPLLGQDSRAVLAEFGVSTESIDELVASGVLVQASYTEVPS